VLRAEFFGNVIEQELSQTGQGVIHESKTVGITGFDKGFQIDLLLFRTRENEKLESQGRDCT
jgi:hypothetical protein